MGWLAELAEVFATRTNDKTQKEEALIAWKNLAEEEATWEVVEDLYKQFPEFSRWNLADARTLGTRWIWNRGLC